VGFNCNTIACYSESSSIPPVQCPPSPELVTSHPVSTSFQDVILYYQEHNTFKDKLITTCGFNRIAYELSTEFQEK